MSAPQGSSCLHGAKNRRKATGKIRRNRPLRILSLILIAIKVNIQQIGEVYYYKHENVYKQVAKLLPTDIQLKLLQKKGSLVRGVFKKEVHKNNRSTGLKNHLKLKHPLKTQEYAMNLSEKIPHQNLDGKPNLSTNYDDMAERAKRPVSDGVSLCHLFIIIENLSF